MKMKSPLRRRSTLPAPLPPPVAVVYLLEGQPQGCVRCSAERILTFYAPALGRKRTRALERTLEPFPHTCPEGRAGDRGSPLRGVWSPRS